MMNYIRSPYINKLAAFGRLLLLCGVTNGWAHHGAYEYDFAETVRIQGRITEYHWRNPHSLIRLLTRDAAGTPVTYQVEIEGPSGLVPLGVSSQSLQPGEHVVATVHPHQTSPVHGLGREVVKQDGTVVPLHPRFADPRLDGPTGTATSIGGHWVPRSADFFAFVGNFRDWPLTASAVAALQTYDVTQSPQVDCLPMSAPAIMLFPTTHTLVFHSNRLVMDADYLGAERVIYLDGRPHPPGDQRLHQGHSVGRWEEDVLIVDTANFTAQSSGLSFGVPGSEQKHLEERLRLAPDRQSLIVDYVLTDPVFLEAPVRASYRWHYRPDLQPSAVPCDRNSARDFLDVDGPRRGSP